MTNATSWAGERKWELYWEWVDWAQSWLQRSTSRVSEGEVKEHTKQEQVHPNHFICCHCWCCNLAKGFSLQWWRWLRVAGRGLRVQEKLVKRSWAVKKKGGGASGKLSPAKYTECQLIALLLHYFSAKCFVIRVPTLFASRGTTEKSGVTLRAQARWWNCTVLSP